MLSTSVASRVFGVDKWMCNHINVESASPREKATSHEWSQA